MGVLAGEGDGPVRAVGRVRGREIVPLRIPGRDAVGPQGLHRRRGIEHVVALAGLGEEPEDGVLSLRGGLRGFGVGHRFVQGIPDLAQGAVDAVSLLVVLLPEHGLQEIGKLGVHRGVGPIDKVPVDGLGLTVAVLRLIARGRDPLLCHGQLGRAGAGALLLFIAPLADKARGGQSGVLLRLHPLLGHGRQGGRKVDPVTGCAADLEGERVLLRLVLLPAQAVVFRRLGEGVEALLVEPVQHPGVLAGVGAVCQGGPDAAAVVRPHIAPEIEGFLLLCMDGEHILLALVELLRLAQIAQRKDGLAVAQVMDALGHVLPQLVHRGERPAAAPQGAQGQQHHRRQPDDHAPARGRAPVPRDPKAQKCPQKQRAGQGRKGPAQQLQQDHQAPHHTAGQHPPPRHKKTNGTAAEQRQQAGQRQQVPHGPLHLEEGQGPVMGQVPAGEEVVEPQLPAPPQGGGTGHGKQDHPGQHRQGRQHGVFLLKRPPQQTAKQGHQPRQHGSEQAGRMLPKGLVHAQQAPQGHKGRQKNRPKETGLARLGPLGLQLLDRLAHGRSPSFLLCFWSAHHPPGLLPVRVGGQLHHGRGGAHLRRGGGGGIHGADHSQADPAVQARQV